MNDIATEQQTHPDPYPRAHLRGRRRGLRKCVTNDGHEFRSTELFAFDGERLRPVEVYFGATCRDGAFVKQQS